MFIADDVVEIFSPIRDSCVMLCIALSTLPCYLCLIFAGRGVFVRLFRSKHSCFAFSQLRLLGELLVAKLERESCIRFSTHACIKR